MCLYNLSQRIGKGLEIWFLSSHVVRSTLNLNKFLRSEQPQATDATRYNRRKMQAGISPYQCALSFLVSTASFLFKSISPSAQGFLSPLIMSLHFSLPCLPTPKGIRANMFNEDICLWFGKCLLLFCIHFLGNTPLLKISNECIVNISFILWVKPQTSFLLKVSW